MQASVAAEIRWRLDLYVEALGQCRRGGFSFARFLALVPDRLRLAEGDRGERVRIPLGVDPALTARLSGALPRSGSGRDERPAGRDELRRYLRLAQTFSDIDVLGLQAWLTTGAVALLRGAASVYGRALGEVGRGEGGVELLYLTHLGLLGALRSALDAARAELGPRVLVAQLLPQALTRAIDASGAAGEGLPARLGMQTALTATVGALGVDMDEGVSRLVTPYRTTPAALALARRVVEAPFETMPVDRVVDAVARRLLADPEARASLGRAMLAEQVRDACLLIAGTELAARADPAITTASSNRALTRALLNTNRRRELARWAREGPVAETRPAQVLASRLEGAQAVLDGDLSTLGVHADLPARAELAARGAVLAALDAHTEQARRDVYRLVDPVAPTELPELHRSGRAYRLALDEAPLYHLPDAAREAALVVDFSAVNQLLSRFPARRAAGLLQAELLGPLLARADRMPGVQRAGASAARLVLRGPVESLVELAQSQLRTLEGLRARAWAGPADALGGLGEAEVLRREERARLEARLLAVDEELSGVAQDPEKVRLLSDTKAMLEGQRAWLEEDGEGLDEGFVVSLALTFGEVASTLEGVPKVAISGPITRAEGLLVRTPWLARSRAARRATAEAARGTEVQAPFRVLLARRDGATSLCNLGCVMSDAARAALEARLVGGRVEERMVELRTLPEALRARHVFELDPEHLRVLVGAEARIVAALRRVGDWQSEPLWELLTPGLTLTEALFGAARGGDSG